MDEINPTQNLNAHYTNVPKIPKPEHLVAVGPSDVPKYHTYTDKEANERFEALNNDIYEAIQSTPKKSKKKFLGIF